MKWPPQVIDMLYLGMCFFFFILIPYLFPQGPHTSIARLLTNLKTLHVRQNHRLNIALLTYDWVSVNFQYKKIDSINCTLVQVVISATGSPTIGSKQSDAFAFLTEEVSRSFFFFTIVAFPWHHPAVGHRHIAGRMVIHRPVEHSWWTIVKNVGLTKGKTFP